MRTTMIICSALLAWGCAARRPISRPNGTTTAVPAPTPPAHFSTKVVEIHYTVRSYREASDPSLRHEAHTIFRRTVVPANAGEAENFETRPERARPTSFSPLPASEELAAELATQTAITAELEALHASMVETERRMRTQYEEQVRRSEEAATLQAGLKAERERLRAQTPPPRIERVTDEATSSTEAMW